MKIKNAVNLLQFARTTLELSALLTGDYVLTLATGSRSWVLGLWGMVCIPLNNVAKIMKGLQDFYSLLLGL